MALACCSGKVVNKNDNTRGKRHCCAAPPGFYAEPEPEADRSGSNSGEAVGSVQIRASQRSTSFDSTVVDILSSAI
eukprot:SAG31_NODE_26694_length_438_cov_0.610619_1_plen_75_part_01